MKGIRLLELLVAILMLSTTGREVRGGDEFDPESFFRQNCASCHNETPVPRAMTRESMEALPPERILHATSNGLMSAFAIALNAGERRRLADHLSDQDWGDPTEGAASERLASCKNAPLLTEAEFEAPHWSGWGVDFDNSRFQPGAHARLDAKGLAAVELRWSFGFPGAVTVGTQPAVVADRLIIGSPEHAVYALNAHSGCAYWKFETEGPVRATPSVVWNDEGPTVFVSDRKAFLYAVDANTGELRWKKRVGRHPAAAITASPVAYRGRIYMGIASFEEVYASAPGYECCTFRGSVVALDARTGDEVWHTYVIPEAPHPTQRAKDGAQLYGPSGAGIWSAPTIDPKRGFLYVTTGDAYSRPASENSDAVVALDLATGAIRWSWQATPDDAYTNLCVDSDADPDFLQECGPDFDFGASAILRELPATPQHPQGRGILLAGQKSGVLHALDPADGTLLWQRRLSPGGVLGGIEWGMSADADTIYVPISDVWENQETPGHAGGVFAVNLRDGSVRWQHPAPEPTCLGTPGCNAGQPQASTLIPGLLFSGSMDGHMRAYRTSDGVVVWDFDTTKEFETVNGVNAAGGSLKGGGATVVNGWIYFTSGYGLFGMPGNVLLAFGPPH